VVFYPIIGSHHFLFSPLPWWLQTVAIVFGVGVLVPVWGGSSNFLLTMRGRVGDMTRSYPLMFIFVGVMSYLIGSTQGTLEAFRSLQQVWHLTNFTVGHSHLTMYGIIGFAIWGGVYALLPLATGKQAGQLGMALSAPASASVTAAAGGYDPAKGAALFTANCSACHQASGEGLPGASRHSRATLSSTRTTPPSTSRRC
jgi:heme/copper-type cytochrome/quinol oxidase subunit 1